MGHIPKGHYANILFDANEVRFIREMAWLWGTYGAMRLHGMVNSFRDEPGAISSVIRNHGHGLAMGYFKAAEVEVRERGYTILEDMAEADPLNKEFRGV